MKALLLSGGTGSRLRPLTYTGAQQLIPVFAHGFCTLVPNTHVMYKVDQFYSSAHDNRIAWDDPDLGIDWSFSNVTLSDRDQRHPKLNQLQC